MAKRKKNSLKIGNMSDIAIIKQIESEIEVEGDNEYWRSLTYHLNEDKKVEELHIRGCDLGDLSRIIYPMQLLSKLEKVVLDHCDITDITPLEELQNLTSLSLVGNKIKDISTLKRLRSLSDVRIGSNEIRDLKHVIDVLNFLPLLTALDLSSIELNGLEDLAKELRTFPALTSLGLASNAIADISPLRAAMSLKSLFLGGNNICDISALKTLTKLRTLDISVNEITDLSPIKALTELNVLRMGENAIVDASPLKYLCKLNEVNAHDCKLGDRSLNVLNNLKNLSTLWLKGNEITDASLLGEFPDLVALSLTENYIRDIRTLQRYQNLLTLHLAENEIHDLNPLSKLKKLQILILAGNKISELSPLGGLSQLRTLDLQQNPIEVLPQSIIDLNMDIVWQKYGFNDGKITLYDNPLKKPSPEIVQKGKTAIKNYFDQLNSQEKDYLFEAKMLIVGEPGAGKTSLMWKLENPNSRLPMEGDTTKGIDVQPYYFNLEKDQFSTSVEFVERTFRLNLWDFGGQEIYKATHRFFLSKRSCYALVADSRNENTDFNYWLHIVEMFGGDSPLIIVLNEKHQRKRNLDIPAMMKRFSNISEVIDVDLAEPDRTRLNNLARAVRYYVTKLQHVGTEVPRNWKLVREALERDDRNTITLQDYLHVCDTFGITKRDYALGLSEYFHDIGVFLHFQDDSVLQRTIFLKPNWATNAVYKLLDDTKLNETNGRFTKEDAKKIWSHGEYAPIWHELLKLMQKFFLVYQVESTDEFIVPERLQPAQPQYPWEKKDNLLLSYKYQIFMPKGIMSQIIVQLHRYIKNHNLVWRRGVILHRDDAIAEIIEAYDARSITIRIIGKNRRDFMTIISEQIDSINSQYEKMSVEKLIPCNCNDCKISESPYFYKFNDLKRRISKSRTTVECGISYDTVNVFSLVDDVFEKHKVYAEICKEHMDQNLSVTVANALSIMLKTEVMKQKSSGKKKPETKSSWANGSFYLFAFMSVVIGLVGLSGFVPLYTLVLIVICGAIAIPIIGSFQLRHDEHLTEKNFVELIKLVYKQLPLISKLVKKEEPAE